MTNTEPTQLVLGVQLRDETNFDNFYLNDGNEQLVAGLRQQADAGSISFLWGALSSGRTHLIQALCHEHAERGLAALYLPLSDSQSLSPDMLQGANSLSLVCLDDVDAICGNTLWERALFSLFNELQESDTRLVLSANCSPQQLQIELPDLKSRLQAAVIYQLATPDDGEKRDILCLRAANRGMELSVQLADFLVQRADRSLAGLIAVLDELDRATLQKGRRLTLPLIKEVLGW